jgi:hypothetical protein
MRNKFPFFFLLNGFIFSLAFLYGADFGLYKSDYFLAHSIAMNHLHASNDLIGQIKSIPNSASGVLPLWIYGFFNSLIIHKLITLGIFLYILFLIYIKTHKKISEFGIIFMSILLISPSMISSVTWCLPEIFTLAVFYTLVSLENKFQYMRYFLAFITPLSRQTFIAIIFSQIIYSKNLKDIFCQLALAGAGLSMLIFIWGGLVPPSKIDMHTNPSVKSFIISQLIFSLYFLISNIENFLKTKHAINYKKIVISLLLSSVVIFINLHLEPLTFGGFIFSRLEELSLPVSFVIEFLLLAFYLCFSNKDTLLFTLICSLTLSTTNLLFIKYTDFFIFAFLAFGLNRSEHALKMKQYAKSILFFQYFSFLLMNIRYPSFFKSMINSLT